MYVALHELEKRQVEQILKSLGCDPSTTDFRRAFFKLARHFCHVAQVRRARGGGAGRKKWTPENECRLLLEMRRLQSEGLSERNAIKKIANDKSYNDVFPYEGRVDDVRVISRRLSREREEEKSLTAMSLQRREEALRKQWDLLKRRIKSEPRPLERAFGLTTPDRVMRIISELDLFPELKLHHKMAAKTNATAAK
jgi:hypothetical protein